MLFSNLQKNVLDYMELFLKGHTMIELLHDTSILNVCKKKLTGCQKELFRFMSPGHAL